MEQIVKNTLEGLKDFQIKSVEHLYKKLYEEGKQRVLLADEVGLGKTIVAKGIIAKAYQNYLDYADKKKNKQFNVVYICSNQALAKQNIDKLNFTGDKSNVDDTVDRLILLAYNDKKIENTFLIQALTPAVSFESRSNYGRIDERAIIFNLITYYQKFNYSHSENRYKGLRIILQGKANKENWLATLKNDKHHDLRNNLYGEYKSLLMNLTLDESLPKTFEFFKRKSYSIWETLAKLCEQIDGRNIHQYGFIYEIIRKLRKELSKICLQFLGADIFILDEFQRFSNIIKLDDEDNENEAIEIARTVFQLKDAKTLLLSATPFKPYTSSYDHLQGEMHQKEFDDVLKFLLNTTSNSQDWYNLIAKRKEFFNFLMNPNLLKENIETAKEVKQELENIYFNVMLRTERLLASEDNNALVSDELNKKGNTRESIAITTDDIEDFVALDKLTIYLNDTIKSKLPIPVEYVKSCPFALSFLQDYQHHKKLVKALAENDRQLDKLMRETKNLWLNTKAINEYKNLLPNSKLPNAKIRLLVNEAIGKTGWKLLWIPPTVCYYKPSGVFENTLGFSKTLVFSAWQMVPRMVSSLLSYEAERSSMSSQIFSEEEKENGLYFKNNSKEKRKPYPQIVFPLNAEDKTPLRLNNFIYKYPSIFLANCVDPLAFSEHNLTIPTLLKQIEDLLREKITFVLSKYGNTTNQRNSDKWQWALPILLDKEFHNQEINKWLNGIDNISTTIIEADDEIINEEESKGEKKYLELAKDLFNGNTNVELPIITDKNKIEELISFVAKLTIGSASVCALRALSKLNIDKTNIVGSAYEIGNSFITLFNKPESIAVVKNRKDDQSYIEDVLDYSIDGNLQAMLDEYIYMLHDAENLKHATDIANHIAEILSVRTTNVKIDDYKTMMSKTVNKPREKNMRCHYAMGFGGTKLIAGKSGKEINVRSAFNSPFRPFVLASTSIGQEGLDFHLYCRKIFHWNLPHNPIDFEQREGRINRYKGHVIRQNLCDKYKQEVFDSNPSEFWGKLFTIAQKEKQTNKSKSDLVPFWHTETQSNIKIERFVPLLPFSRDIERYRNLLKVLTYYRLTFGQARQDELIEAMDGDCDKELLNELMINLSSLNLSYE